VGIGCSQCTGSDYSSEAAHRLKRVLSTDIGIGAVGHPDAGYLQTLTMNTVYKIVIPVLYKIPGE
jgi:urocanate hydratase